ncbi:MAG: cupredoxin family copper-binding protein [Rhodospirillales bacterium]|nr:cupredoxin family copper-binding protein [Rhodospirillales bacterium]MBN8896661.1 cupredoxin family copper-binding protein [Rhodospirillales bacterium]
MRRKILGGLCAALLLAFALPLRADEAPSEAVTIDNFTFQPAVLRIKPGTRVVWTNHDDIPHSVVLGATGVRSPTLDTDASFAYRFEKAGTFAYICGLHPHMKGQVVVAP